MACDQRWLEILSAWQDGEASGEETLRARVHLATCARCRTMQGEIRRIHQAFGVFRQEPAPAPSPLAPRPGVSRGPVRRRPWMAAGALAASVAALLLWSSHRHREAIADELEARHLTAFARTSPCEFTSSDPVAIRAWVAGNLGYDVEVPVIPGARLLGVRRCSVHGGLTASLLYRRGEEPLSLFLPRAGTPIEIEAARMSRLRQGCTVGRLGAAVCARPGLFAVAETEGTALAALEAY